MRARRMTHSRAPTTMIIALLSFQSLLMFHSGSAFAPARSSFLKQRDRTTTVPKKMAGNRRKIDGRHPPELASSPLRQDEESSTSCFPRKHLLVGGVQMSPAGGDGDYNSEEEDNKEEYHYPVEQQEAVMEHSHSSGATGQSVVSKLGHGLSTTARDLVTVVQSDASSPAQKLQSILTAPAVEATLGGLVLFNSVLVAIDTLPDLQIQTRALVSVSQEVIAYVFGLEFFGRWYASPERGSVKYWRQPLVLVDLMVVVLPLLLGWLGPTSSLVQLLPTWLTSRSTLINLRLLRILRLQRVLLDNETFAKFEVAMGFSQSDVRPFQLQLARVVLSIFTLLSVSTGLIYTAEHAVNPQIPDYFTAFYFGLTTLTTVGFGDITPVTTAGRLVVSVSILVGVAIIPAQAASLAEALLDFQRKKNNPKGEQPQRQESTTTLLETRSSDRTPTARVSDHHDGMPPNMVDATTPCADCGATFHWNGAKFCWSCGSELPSTIP